MSAASDRPNPTGFPWWLSACLLLTAALCAVSIWERAAVESRNKATTLAVEMSVAKRLAAAEGIEPEAALAGMGTQGIRAVVIPEQTLGDLEAAGALSFGGGRMLIQRDGERIVRALRNRFPTLPDPEPTALGLVPVPIPDWDVAMVRSVSAGMNPRDAKLAQQMGLAIAVRLSNPDGAQTRTVTESLRWAKELGATFFMPQGEAVLGRRNGSAAFREGLKSFELTYLAPEFARIAGDAAVVEALPQRVVRLHTAQAAELDKLSPAAVVERFVKAVAERNHRFLLIRPINDVAEHPLDEYTELVRTIRLQLRREGYPMGVARPFEGAEPLVWIAPLIGLTLAGPLIFLLQGFGPNRRAVWAGLLLAAILGMLAITATGRQGLALFAATLFPVLAYVAFDRLKSPTFIAGIVGIPLLTMLGGAIVVAVLNGLPFMVKADVFSGVKIAHFLPMALVGLYFFARGGAIQRQIHQPATWAQLGLGLLILAGLGFMATRTGNDGPGGVSGLELQLRSVLEQYFPVRPRTKEFLIGFPALVIAIGWTLHRRATVRNESEGWGALAMMVSAIGPTSAVNTLCHLHTPLQVGALRIATGWMVGCIIGAAGWAIVRTVLVRGPKI